MTRTLKMIRKVSLALLCVALTAGSAHAALIAQATLVKQPPGNPFTAPDAGLGAPWVSYQLSVTSTDPLELIGAVDVQINGNKLHQRWQDADFDGITDPTPNGAPSNGRGDSHLTAPAGSPFGQGPGETNTKAGSPLTSTPGTTEYGVGNLSGAWGILVPGLSANLAYIVINSADATPSFDIRVTAATPTGQPFNQGVALDGEDFFIPEPATMSLLGLALVACLGFRRRNG
jgi:hypothetical protein